MLPLAAPNSSSCSFLFFKLMLLWVLSCLYENKNNPKASASAQPLPEALTTAGGPAQPPPPYHHPRAKASSSAAAATFRQESPELLPGPRTGICACGREARGCSGLCPATACSAWSSPQPGDGTRGLLPAGDSPSPAASVSPGRAHPCCLPPRPQPHPDAPIVPSSRPWLLPATISTVAPLTLPALPCSQTSPREGNFSLTPTPRPDPAQPGLVPRSIK